MNKIDNITKTVKNIVGSWTSDNTIKPDVNVYRKFNYSIFVSNCISTFLKNKIQNKEVENTKNFINLLSLEDLSAFDFGDTFLGEGVIELNFWSNDLENSLLIEVIIGPDEIGYTTDYQGIYPDKAAEKNKSIYSHRNSRKSKRTVNVNRNLWKIKMTYNLLEKNPVKK